MRELAQWDEYLIFYKVMKIAETETWSSDQLMILVLVFENMDEGFALPPSTEVSASQSIEKPTKRVQMPQ